MNEENHTCAYCGAPATHQFKNGKWCCQENKNNCPAVKRNLSEKARINHQKFKEKYGNAGFKSSRVITQVIEKYPSRGDHVCAYCGGYAEFQLKSGKWCCHRTTSGCPEIKRKNSQGCKNAYIKGRKKCDFSEHLVWNKGLTSETDERVKSLTNKLKEGYKTGRIIPSFRNRKHTDDTKEKISISMKKAHAEGRAHNIGECRWNNKPSWPEQWFMTVIENEFTDKKYQREFPFHRFSLDFAWVEKKKCIEIDGEQHEVDVEQKRRDLQKDNLLHEDGWKLLRMPWKEVFKNPKHWINKARTFIDE